MRWLAAGSFIICSKAVEAEITYRYALVSGRSSSTSRLKGTRSGPKYRRKRCASSVGGVVKTASNAAKTESPPCRRRKIARAPRRSPPPRLIDVKSTTLLLFRLPPSPQASLSPHRIADDVIVYQACRASEGRARDTHYFKFLHDRSIAKHRAPQKHSSYTIHMATRMLRSGDRIFSSRSMI